MVRSGVCKMIAILATCGLTQISALQVGLQGSMTPEEAAALVGKAITDAGKPFPDDKKNELIQAISASFEPVTEETITSIFGEDAAAVDMPALLAKLNQGLEVDVEATEESGPMSHGANPLKMTDEEAAAKADGEIGDGKPFQESQREELINLLKSGEVTHEKILSMLDSPQSIPDIMRRLGVYGTPKVQPNMTEEEATARVNLVVDADKDFDQREELIKLLQEDEPITADTVFKMLSDQGPQGRSDVMAKLGLAYIEGMDPEQAQPKVKLVKDALTAVGKELTEEKGTALMEALTGGEIHTVADIVTEILGESSTNFDMDALVAKLMSRTSDVHEAEDAGPTLEPPKKLNAKLAGDLVTLLKEALTSNGNDLDAETEAKLIQDLENLDRETAKGTIERVLGEAEIELDPLLAEVFQVGLADGHDSVPPGGDSVKTDAMAPGPDDVRVMDLPGECTKGGGIKIYDADSPVADYAGIVRVVDDEDRDNNSKLGYVRSIKDPTGNAVNSVERVEGQDNAGYMIEVEIIGEGQTISLPRNKVCNQIPQPPPMPLPTENDIKVALNENNPGSGLSGAEQFNRLTEGTLEFSEDILHKIFRFAVVPELEKFLGRPGPLGIPIKTTVFDWLSQDQSWFFQQPEDSFVRGVVRGMNSVHATPALSSGPLMPEQKMHIVAYTMQDLNLKSRLDSSYGAVVDGVLNSDIPGEIAKIALQMQDLFESSSARILRDKTEQALYRQAIFDAVDGDKWPYSSDGDRIPFKERFRHVYPDLTDKLFDRVVSELNAMTSDGCTETLASAIAEKFKREHAEHMAKIEEAEARAGDVAEHTVPEGEMALTSKEIEHAEGVGIPTFSDVEEYLGPKHTVLRTIKGDGTRLPLADVVTFRDDKDAAVAACIAGNGSFLTLEKAALEERIASAVRDVMDGAAVERGAEVVHDLGSGTSRVGDVSPHMSCCGMSDCSHLKKQLVPFDRRVEGVSDHASTVSTVPPPPPPVDAQQLMQKQQDFMMHMMTVMHQQQQQLQQFMMQIMSYILGQQQIGNGQPQVFNAQQNPIFFGPPSPARPGAGVNGLCWDGSSPDRSGKCPAPPSNLGRQSHPFPAGRMIHVGV